MIGVEAAGKNGVSCRFSADEVEQRISHAGMWDICHVEVVWRAVRPNSTRSSL